MTPPRSAIGSLAALPIVRNAWLRRAIAVMLIAICAAFTLFPERYRAAVTLTPTDPQSLGLNPSFNQLGAVGNVFGNQTAVEVSLKVARSEFVRALVIRRLDLARVIGKSPLDTHRWLDREVDIRALRGGIIQFDVKLADPELARRIVGAYGTAVREQMAIVTRNQIAQKRDIVLELVDGASARLATAQATYDSFRLQTRESSPQAAIFAANTRIAELEGSIRAKQVELNTLRQFATDENIRVRQARTELATLQAQLAEARSVSPGERSSVGQLVQQSTQGDKLRRDLELAQSLYDTYRRFLQTTSVEDLTSSANVRILEPPFVDTARQFNTLPLALGIVIALLALAVEFYRIRPPVGERAIA